MNGVSILIAATLMACGGSVVQAQYNSRVAPGVVAPDSPRILRDGEIEPAPAARTDGGVGEQEVPFDRAQTLTGGPVGGNKTQQK